MSVWIFFKHFPKAFLLYEAHQYRRGQCYFLISTSPKVEAIGVVVDILRFRGMELYDGIPFVPEEILHKAHLFPIRTSVLERHRHMLPPISLAVGCQYS